MNLEKTLEENLMTQRSIIKDKRGVERELRKLRKKMIRDGDLHQLIEIYCGRGTSPKKLSSFLLGNARYWSGNTKTNKRHYDKEEEDY